MSWRRERLPIPVFWPGEFHGLYSLMGRKESDTTETLSLSFTKVQDKFYLFNLVHDDSVCGSLVKNFSVYLKWRPGLWNWKASELFSFQQYISFPTEPSVKSLPNCGVLRWEAPSIPAPQRQTQLWLEMVLNLGLQFFKEAPIFFTIGYKSYLHKVFTT